MDAEIKISNLGWYSWEIRVLNKKYSHIKYLSGDDFAESRYTMIILGQRTYLKRCNARRFAVHYAKKLNLNIAKIYG